MGQRLAVCGLPLLFLNRQQMVCFRQVAEPGRLFSRQQMHAQSLLPGQCIQPCRELPQFRGKPGRVFRQQQERGPLPIKAGAVCHWRGIQLVPQRLPYFMCVYSDLIIFAGSI